ncbi:MAG: FemAB family PEP-CTERM system-associated protein [Rhodospirillales bacterium]|nr:FemAB family PEP-CTERM system-associated protein [Rhodospirillales bacterium]
MALRIAALDAARRPAWDAFVAAHPQASFFHRSLWLDVIDRAMGHTPQALIAEQDGAIAAILPLVAVKSRLFGHRLVSLPFCVQGGLLSIDPAADAALEQAAIALMDRSGAAFLELRDAVPAAPPFVAQRDLYVAFRKPIGADDEANMKAIPRKQRAMVRKAIQHGLSSVVHRDAAALHRIYAESVRNLGTPVFSRRYFAILLEAFGKDADIVSVQDGETPVAAVMNFYFRDQVLPYYGGGTARARGCAGNDFMYWEVMRRAAAAGARLFDFGRSKIGTGAYAFKRNWGFEPVPMHYRYRLRPGDGVPEINPLNPKYRLFIAAWKRLPLPLANAIGPHLARGLG